MKYLLSALCCLFLSSSCTAQTAEQGGSVKTTDIVSGGRMKVEDITAQTVIDRVIADTDFSPWGRLIFPVDSGYWSGTTLGSLRLTWYSHIDAAKTVEVVRYFKTQTLRGEPVFFDIYTEEEKRLDPRKRNTGLFFFSGKKGAKSAICSAGGGFAYVGAMHDSFPHALELSKRGYNAFALIYRPAKILLERLPLFMNTLGNCSSIPQNILCGVVQRVRGWQHGSAVWGRNDSAKKNTRVQLPSSCSTQDFRKCTVTNRRHTPVSEPQTVSQVFG